MRIRILDVFLSIYMQIRLLSINTDILSILFSSRFQFYHIVDLNNPLWIQDLLLRN